MTEVRRQPQPEIETPAQRCAREVLKLRAQSRQPGKRQKSVPAAIAAVLDRHGIQDDAQRQRLFREIGGLVGKEGAQQKDKERIERWRQDAVQLQTAEERRAGATYEEMDLEG